MESKKLKQGLQRIINGFESGDYPYESDFIDILKGAIENQKACSHSALNDRVIQKAELDKLENIRLELHEIATHNPQVEQMLIALTSKLWQIIHRKRDEAIV